MLLRDWVLGGLIVGLCPGLVAQGQLLGAKPPRSPRAEPVRIPDPIVAHLVRRSMKGAARRLERPQCRRLFQEYADGEGRLLESVLAERGFDPAGYLENMLFYDGASTRGCGRAGVIALTITPGSRAIQICPSHFRSIAVANPTLAEVSLIHEMLHSLGLGENPPASEAITERVLDLCL